MERRVRPVIETEHLSKRYGRHEALRGLDLVVPRGVVFGYLGPNGAGKTTTIRLLVGLLRPTSGSVTVLGDDAVADRDSVQRRVGYLPGHFVAYRDLTGEQYLRFLGHLRGGTPWHHVEQLAKRFDLDLMRRIGALSHGNRQKVGILQAFAHEPELIVLDEPTTGLDPLVQREFLDLVRESRAQGRTVFLSSHVLSEVEAVADMVAILRGGELVVVQAVETLKQQARRRVDMVFEDVAPAAALRGAPGVRDVTTKGHEAFVTVEGSMAPLLSAAAPYRIDRLVTHEPDLEQIFLGFYDAERTS
jgi:ABC-2 type transport system ATP-binding protein